MSIEIRVEASDIEAFARKIRRLDKAMQEQVQQGLVQLAEDTMWRAKVLAPIRTGRLMQSIYAQVIYRWIIKVGCYVPYAYFQEFGTRYIQPRYFLTRALTETAPRLLSILQSSFEHATREAAVE